MITTMSRIVVAATEASKEKTLNSLREWGLLHVLPLQAPEGEKVVAAKTALANAQRVFEAISYRKSNAPENAIEEHDLLAQINSVMQSRKEAEEALALSSAELKRVEAFGEFDPHKVRKLIKHDIIIKLYSADEKTFKNTDNDIVIKEFKRENGKVFFAAISKEPIELPYSEISLPPKPVKELKLDIEKATKIIDECKKKLKAYASKKNKIGELVVEASDELAFTSAEAGMRSEIGVCFIQGYCPKEKLASLNELAAKNGWGISAEDPTEEEAVPTLLKHKKLVKPIDALYNVIGINPGYREIDVSAVFLCFFSIFFAMIVGDVAYGLLFVAITFFVSKKLKNAPRYPFQFLYLMSGCTIVWGFLNANYLGLFRDGDVMVVPDVLDIIKASWAPQGLKDFAAWVRDDNNTQFLCFNLAVIHLTIARAWNAFAHRDNKAAVVTQVGWICTTWMMFFLVCNLVLGHAFPQEALYVGIGGAVIIIIGSGMKSDWFSVGMLPLNLVSNLVDVISYIRLFAVGMAGYSVANAFSGMVAPMFGSIAGSVCAALILLLVHSLNIALSAMGVAVHAVRLNTLEFSNSVGVEWSGRPYTPFRKNV
jgi:V/A-type H+/Na+-transporting ATPase subunit I